MKSKHLIEERLRNSYDPTVIETLKWVLESPECPLCNHPNRKEMELSVFKEEMTTVFLETKMNWRAGSVEEHMSHHIDYNPLEAKEVEELRKESITTLDMANDIFGRINQWLDEWEKAKDAEGITKEWIGEATKLVGQANSSLKLIGQLKKEIGVDSQLMLAEQKVSGVMGIIVDTLRDHPQLMNQLELRLATLKAPPTHIVEADFEVVD
tara:strand:+ start:8423 stop:9052 length:630 start_codon:yes stop_codon:yes gene_type:complete